MRVSAAVLVSVAWATLAVAYGLFFSFSVFFVPLIEEFRWSRGLTAGAMSVSAIVQGLCAPLAGGCGATCFWLARRPAP